MNRTESSPTISTQCAWKLLDWQGFSTNVESANALETIIRRIPSQGTTPNRIVDLESPAGDILSFGVAGPGDLNNPGLDSPLACVQFTAASLDPPYLAVVGDASLDYENGGVVVFQYDGSWTEILRRNCVPVDVMVRIARSFYANENLPDWVSWEEV